MNVIYNRQKAVAYARNWALTTNAKYGRMTNDCTNFVSQVMFEGGMPMVGSHNAFDRGNAKQWWFGGSLLVNATHSWGGAQNFYDYLKLSGRAQQVASIDELTPGDVVQFISVGRSHIWHSTIVTGTAQGDILLSYHTNDNLDKPLNATDVPLDLCILWKIADSFAMRPCESTGPMHWK